MRFSKKPLQIGSLGLSRMPVPPPALELGGVRPRKGSLGISRVLNLARSVGTLN